MLKKYASVYRLPLFRKRRFEKMVELTKKEVNGIPNINCGGCALVAKHLYKAYRGLGFSAVAIILTETPHVVESYILGQNTGMSSYMDISHVIIRANGHFVDSTGAYKSIDDIPDFGERNLFGIECDYTTLCKMIDEHTWNRRFDWNKYCGYVEEKIEDIQRKALKSLVI